MDGLRRIEVPAPSLVIAESLLEETIRRLTDLLRNQNNSLESIEVKLNTVTGKHISDEQEDGPVPFNVATRLRSVLTYLEDNQQRLEIVYEDLSIVI